MPPVRNTRRAPRITERIDAIERTLLEIRSLVDVHCSDLPANAAAAVSVIAGAPPHTKKLIRHGGPTNFNEFIKEFRAKNPSLDYQSALKAGAVAWKEKRLAEGRPNLTRKAPKVAVAAAAAPINSTPGRVSPSRILAKSENSSANSSNSNSSNSNSSANSSANTPRLNTPKVPTPKLPTPKGPTPKLPTPKAPTPDSSDSSDSDSSNSDSSDSNSSANTPKSRTPKAPTPKVPTPKVPTPNEPTPDSPDVNLNARLTGNAPSPLRNSPRNLLKNMYVNEGNDPGTNMKKIDIKGKKYFMTAFNKGLWERLDDSELGDWVGYLEPSGIRVTNAPDNT